VYVIFLKILFIKKNILNRIKMSATDANVNFRSVSTATDRPQVINANIVKAGVLSGNQSVLGGLTEKTFVGYTPSGIAWGSVAASGVYLNTAPSQAATSSTAVNLVLPVGSVIRAAQLVQNGTALVGGALNVCTAAVGGAMQDTLISSAPVALCNTGVGAINFNTTAAGLNQMDAADRITVYPPGTAVTAGSAVVYLSVLVPNA
jgi:hypothetical protein